MKEDNKLTNWKIRAAEEHELRLQAEQTVKELTATCDDTQTQLKKSSNYNSYLESKYYDLEAEFSCQKTKLMEAVSMLAKAKQLITHRKDELSALQEDNIKLKVALAKKSELLNAEMLQHEQTNHKLAMTLRKLTNIHDDDFKLTATTTPPTDTLEDYFAHKVLSAPSTETVDTNTIKSDADFMSQLRYIEHQYFQKT